MTIDERLEKLTERHEAMAQTLELFITETRAFAATMENNMAELQKHMVALMDNNNKLSNIIIAHDEQLEPPRTQARGPRRR
jgi:hypothetical protein